MERKLLITNMKELHVGDSILVQGKVESGADRFAINLGQDDSNYLIHFNPRFEGNGVVVYNSKKNTKWDSEIRDYHFPFKRGEETMISFTFHSDEVAVNYPDGHLFDFKKQISLNSVKYISVDGNFEIQAINNQ